MPGRRHTRTRALAVVLFCGTVRSLAPVAAPAHERFLSEFAHAKPPAALGGLLGHLLSGGDKIVPPGSDANIHPLLIPLSRSSDDEITGLLRWPASSSSSALPVVRTTAAGRQLLLLADSAEDYLTREAAVADDQGRPDAASLAELATASGCTYTAGAASAGPGGLQGYLITKVGPFVSAYEELAQGHRVKGSDTAALVTCERSQACFGAWGRPFAFHARMLHSLWRDEEARDKARAAFERPWWTLGDDPDEMLGFAKSNREEEVARLQLKAEGKLTTEQLRTQNGMENRTPQQIAKDRASYLLDLVVAAPDEYSWAGIRAELAGHYRAAGMGQIADFVSGEGA
jgi:hypothetical protein